MLLMVVFAFVANRKLKKASPDKPDAFQNVIELIVEMLDNMVKGTMGKWAPKFVNYISTIFIFILMSNISGLFGLRPPTADYGTTLALALITFCMIHFNKIRHQSPKTIWTDMCSPLPPWLPLWGVLALAALARLAAAAAAGAGILALSARTKSTVYTLLIGCAVLLPVMLLILFQ